MVKDRIGEEFWLGIRPENIGNRLTSPEGTTKNFIEGKINLVEQMGNEEFIYFMIGDTQYTSRVPVEKSTGVNFNEKENFYFDMTKCHLFDIASEENVTL